MRARSEMPSARIDVGPMVTEFPVTGPIENSVHGAELRGCSRRTIAVNATDNTMTAPTIRKPVRSATAARVIGSPRW
jgi:hypothetical protein